MYALRKDTLAGIKQSALFDPRKINVMLPRTVARMNSYLADGKGMLRPEAEAVKFYYANHVFSLIAQRYGPHEPLPAPVAWLARNYVKMSNDIVVRLAYYTLMIIVREARHFHGPASVLSSIDKECGKPAGDFFRGMGGGEETILDKLKKHPPEIALENFIRAVEKIFFEGQWGSGYGGPKWGHIAKTLGDMVRGKLSAEMFADTAFTLAHNGGPMFNKGMLYYTQDTAGLWKILDVQAAGQIPQLVNDGVCGEASPSVEFQDYIAKARDVFPADLSGYVDWYLVEARMPIREGQKRSYPAEKQAQVVKHGMSPFASKAETERAEREKKRAELMALAEKKKFYVGPHPTQFAIITERKAA